MIDGATLKISILEGVRVCGEGTHMLDGDSASHLKDVGPADEVVLCLDGCKHLYDTGKPSVGAMGDLWLVPEGEL